MGDMVVKEMLDPVDRRCSVQDTHQVRMDAAHSTRSMAMRLYGLIITSLGFVLSLLRQICWCIASEEGKGLSKEIQRLKEGLSGIPFTVNEIKGWIAAQDKLLGNQLKAVCRDFVRVYQNPDVSLLLRSMLSKAEGPKRVSDVRDIAGIIGKHLELKRERIHLDFERQEISRDDFLSMIEHDPIRTWYSPNRECVELHVTLCCGNMRPSSSVVRSLYFTLLEWHTRPFFQGYALGHIPRCIEGFEDWSVSKGPADCLESLQAHEFKDGVCFVSATRDGATGAPRVGRIQRRRNTFKRRQLVVTTGDSDIPYYIARSGRIVVSKRGIGLCSSTPCYIITRSFRLAATRRRRRRRAPPLWIYDTGSSISLTGDLSLLRGVHDADHMTLGGVSGAKLVSNKCGRIRSGRVKLSGIRYFRGSQVNLISGGILASLGCETIMNAKGCMIMKDGQVIGAGRRLPDNTYSVEYLCDKLLGGTGCHRCRH